MKGRIGDKRDIGRERRHWPRLESIFKWSENESGEPIFIFRKEKLLRRVRGNWRIREHTSPFLEDIGRTERLI
jgi:hypothetical protein